MISYSVDPDEKLIYISIPGETDLAEILEIMRQIAADDRLGPGFGILTDARTIEYSPSAKDVRRIADLASELALFSRHPNALVVSRMIHYGLGNMLALITERRGALVQPFYEIEEARAWLRLHREQGSKN